MEKPDPETKKAVLLVSCRDFGSLAAAIRLLPLEYQGKIIEIKRVEEEALPNVSSET
jgi:hypothetical protein